MNRFHRWYCRSSHWEKTLGQEILPWALDGVNLGRDILEVGPGPGLTTNLLRQRFGQVTAIEIDPLLAASLKTRFSSTNVVVVEGDATQMPFADGSFSGVVSFTMLHHVPSPALQQGLLAEVYRVLKPGGTFVGTDSTWSLLFQLFHLFDTMTVVDPQTFGARLERAGFTDARVETASRRFKFCARHP